VELVEPLFQYRLLSDHRPCLSMVRTSHPSAWTVRTVQDAPSAIEYTVQAPALRRIASNMRAGQMKRVTQRMDQQDVVARRPLPLRAVNVRFYEFSTC